MTDVCSCVGTLAQMSNRVYFALLTACEPRSIACIVASVVGFTNLRGWKLGILESINFVMVGPADGTCNIIDNAPSIYSQATWPLL